MSDAGTPETDGYDEIEDSSAPLIEHLAELRTRLIRAVIAFLIAICVFFIPVQGEFIAQHLLEWLLDPIVATLRAMGDPSPTLQYTSPTELLFVLFRISMVFGFALAFPVISYQLWRFVAPGLYRKEKDAFLPFVIASPVMFILGASFAQFVVTPLAMTFLLGFTDAASIFQRFLAAGTETQLPPDMGLPAPGIVQPDNTVGDVSIVFLGKVNESLDITLKFIIAFGMCFQLPVLLTLMGKAGLVSAEGLKAVRKWAIVGILLLAALITPPDVVTQLILFTVVYGLYEISIFLVARVETKREDQLREDGYYDDEDEDDAEIHAAEQTAQDSSTTKDSTN